MTLFQATLGINREGQERFVAAAQQTHEGQAHFGGSGPLGRTCRECGFWQKTGSFTAKGGPRALSCRKFQDLLFLTKAGPRVPHSAHACRFFSLTESPQPLERPQRSFTP